MLNIVLLNPEIPPNTGNIGRLSLGTDARLVIVGEPRFDLSEDAALKRAGLDYWDRVSVQRFSDWESYKTNTSGQRYLITKYAELPYHRCQFESGDHLIFGGETRGAPEHVHEDSDVTSICIPMTGEIRSFNVCNAVAVVTFEALRQIEPGWFTRTPYSRMEP